MMVTVVTYYYKVTIVTMIGVFLMKPISRISEAELAVMKILWDSGGPVTTGAMYKELSETLSWDRSTVRTLLKRLAEKGAVEEKKAQVLCYLPTVTEREYRDAQTKRFLERLYGGSARNLVASLVQSNELTRGDIEELRDFLNQGGNGHA